MEKKRLQARREGNIFVAEAFNRVAHRATYKNYTQRQKPSTGERVSPIRGSDIVYRETMYRPHLSRYPL